MGCNIIRVFAVAALIFLASAVFAFSNEDMQGIPDSIEFRGNEPVELNFTVFNSSGFDREIFIEFNFPAKVIENSAPRIIEGGKTAEFSFELIPEEGTENSSYSGTIDAMLGDDEITKTISLNFEKANAEEGKIPAAEENEENKNSSNAVSGLAGLISLHDISKINLIEFAVNAFLFIVVALLLIVFISRLTQTLYRIDRKRAIQNRVGK